jgi:hypothetical protein
MWLTAICGRENEKNIDKPVNFWGILFSDKPRLGIKGYILESLKTDL